VKKNHSYLTFFFLLVIVRGFFNFIIPLTDKTEARYSEIARLMSETGNWVVPQIDYGVPFWAKPPLSTWLSAMSISIFGENEFSVRLPSLVLSLLMAFFISKYIANKKLPFFLPCLILFSLPEFFLHAGVVSTDISLSFSIMLIMISFWEISKKTSFLWESLFVFGIAMGLLSKGPISIVLTFPPLLIWGLRFKLPIKKLFRISWLFGLLLALPWYFLAEKNSPGFTNYFIVGEHFLRFIDSSWTGDKYGFPKQQPLGIIWVFLILGTLPWIFSLLKKLIKIFRSIWDNKWEFFLWSWLLWTPIFFTISKSLIHTYIMPVMVPLTLLVCHYWENLKFKKIQLGFSIFIPILLLISYSFKDIRELVENKSDKILVEKSTSHFAPIYSLEVKSYSSQFYSKGKIKKIDYEELEKLIKENNSFFIIIKENKINSVALETKNKLITVHKRSGKSLYSYNVSSKK